MNNRPLILITNDDGINSPGIQATAEALFPLADLLIAAPATQQSATGRALQHTPQAVFQKEDLIIQGKALNAWSLKATPATTTRHALQCLTPNRVPDMVVSGINFGENVGNDVTVSGTVGAALQSATWNIKSLAVSLEVPKEFHHQYGEVSWLGAIHILRRAAQRLLSSSWPEDVHVIKIDIPDNADKDTPWRITRQSRESRWHNHVPHPDQFSPVDSVISEYGPVPGRTWQENEDIATVVTQREVSFTPLSVDLSSRSPLTSVEKILA